MVRAGEVPVGPLRDWIRARMREAPSDPTGDRELQHGRERPLVGIGYAAMRLGISERRLYRLMHEAGCVTALNVDRWLTHAGVHVSEVYGPLPPLQKPDAIGCAECLRCGEVLVEPADLCGFCIEEDQLAQVPSGAPGRMLSSPSREPRRLNVKNAQQHPGRGASADRSTR